MSSIEPTASTARPSGGRAAAGKPGTSDAPDTSDASDASDAPSVRPKARPANLRRAPKLFRLSMGLFFIGGLALLVVLVMFASGTRDFPLWLWLLVALAPIGLVAGSFGVGRAGTALDT